MKGLFYIPRQDRITLLCILVIAVLLISIRSLYDTYSLSEYHQSIVTLTKEKNQTKGPLKESKSNTKPPIAQQPFDPNKATVEELESYGFSKYSANNLVKYVAAGGKIKSKEQLYSIYGVDKSHIDQIEHLLRFPKTRQKAKEPKREPHNTSKETKVKQKDRQPIVLQDFDPNTVDSATLRSMGISRYATNNLLKYRSRGGTFKSDTQLASIYGLDSNTYQRLLPYIKISQGISDEDSLKNSNYSRDTTTYKNIILDINYATSEELIHLKGIGPFTSEKIVKYRNELGGYHSLEQLLEIYNFKKETLESLRPQLKVSGSIRRIYIPATEFKKVLSHPYMDYETTKILKGCPLAECDAMLPQMIKDSIIDHRMIPYLVQSLEEWRSYSREK